ncbi:IS91 family transposase [Sorangium sp. So ce362]|uniref:IS91 family transposase n=1 Tax=Sorangium sp. So ce362 TaxID=3133303 RepID=UPI003F5D7308
MLRLADVVRRHGPAYMERHGASMMPSHVRAVKAILHCRTPTMGGHVAACPQCGREHVLYHSCRHRACPQCGHDATKRWLVQQRELLLPIPYFHVVFTLPAELRRLVRSHQRALVPVLFQAAFESLARLCADPHFLGGRIGALGVLHTWTRTLEWHPHVHLLVPGGGIAPDGRTWRAAPPRRTRYLVPVRALSKLFRGRFLHLARRALPRVAVPQIPWSKSWVVFAKPVVQGAEKVLEYLGRYVHRTAISDQGLVGFDDRTVTFRYRDSRDHRRKTMTLPAHEFLRRFLQHVPPKGLHRVRAFGLLHPAHRDTLQRLQLLLAPRQRPESSTPGPRTPPRRLCPHCGQGSLSLVRRLSPAECVALANALAAESTVQPPARAPP